MVKLLFFIINIIVIYFTPAIVYLLTGIIAATGIIMLDFPRSKQIIKKYDLKKPSLTISIFLAIIIDTFTWVYSLLSFSKLVFSGDWEKETNGNQ